MWLFTVADGILAAVGGCGSLLALFNKGPGCEVKACLTTLWLIEQIRAFFWCSGAFLRLPDENHHSSSGSKGSHQIEMRTLGVCRLCMAVKVVLRACVCVCVCCLQDVMNNGCFQCLLDICSWEPCSSGRRIPCLTLVCQE